MSIPIQLWRAEKDQPAPDAWNSAILRQELRTLPEEHVVKGVDHFVFLAPCSAALMQAAPSICKDAVGFDRADFHASFNAEIVAFFQAKPGLTLTGQVMKSAASCEMARQIAGRAPCKSPKPQSRLRFTALR